MRILVIDPSGNFHEGKGSTGYVYFDNTKLEFNTIKAKDYRTRVEYWFNVAFLIAKYVPEIIVVEDYRLYNTASVGAAAQSFSQLETPRLLGILEATAQQNNVPLVFQMAHMTKPYEDKKLEKLGILQKQKGRWYFRGTPLNDHERSALRHLLRYAEKEGITI